MFPSLETDLKNESCVGPFFSKTKLCTILSKILFESPKHKLSKMVKQIFLGCLESEICSKMLGKSDFGNLKNHVVTMKASKQKASRQSSKVFCKHNKSKGKVYTSEHFKQAYSHKRGFDCKDL